MTSTPAYKNVTGYFMAEIITPPGINLFDGIASEAFQKNGRALR